MWIGIRNRSNWFSYTWCLSFYVNVFCFFFFIILFSKNLSYIFSSANVFHMLIYESFKNISSLKNRKMNEHKEIQWSEHEFHQKDEHSRQQTTSETLTVATQDNRKTNKEGSFISVQHNTVTIKERKWQRNKKSTTKQQKWEKKQQKNFFLFI